MRLALSLPVALLLAACRSDSPPAANEIGAANVEAAAANGAEAAPVETGSAAPAPLNPPAPGELGGLDNDTTPVSEAPFTEDSAQGAANVVQTYYALLEAGKYGQAYRLWEPASVGMTPAQFAASFERYAEYHANVGAPGAIESGAGQRYVTVPVQVYGRLKQGQRPFDMRGSVALHRVGDIDGAKPEQRRWRIRSSDVKPGGAAPAPEPIEDSRSTARYRCMDGSRLVARFDPDKDRVTVSRGRETLATLRGQRAASGIRFAADGYELRAKGIDMTFTAPGQPPIACTAIR